jgi:hypothetical protein
VYGVCWQDVTEPWGWEPRSLWRLREDAEAELERVVEEYARGVGGWRGERTTREETFAWARQCHSVQEYEVQ